MHARKLCAKAGKFAVVPEAGSPSPSSLRDATSPKGRGKSTAGSFFIVPNTLVMNFTAWLSLWESWQARQGLTERAHAVAIGTKVTRAMRSLSVAPKAVPLRKVDCREAARRKGYSAAAPRFRGKQALSLPFSSMTPSVKKASDALRRARQTRNYK